MRKRLVLLQALAILMAVFQYGVRAAGQDEGRYSPRSLSTIFYPYLSTARYVQNCIPSPQLYGKIPPFIHYPLLSIQRLKIRFTKVFCACNLSRIHSGIDEWLAATGYTVNRAHIRGHRKGVRKRHDRMPLWMVLPQILIGILNTYGTRKVSFLLHYTSVEWDILLAAVIFILL